MDDLCDILEAEILKNKSSEEDKQMLLKRLRTFCNTETNIMLVGATGCGKSSTINAFFACGEQAETTEEGGQTEKRKYVEVAKVGSKADPETRDIEKYRIGNLVLWDTPGLGDGTEIDEHHKEVITELLTEEDDVFMCIVALGIIQQYYINTKTATFISKVLAILEKNIKKIPDEIFNKNNFKREDILFFATMSDGDYIQEMLDASVRMFNAPATVEAYTQ